MDCTSFFNVCNKNDIITKFFKMINTKDYESAYNLLNNDFRNSNFGTLDNFINYVKNNFYSNTIITDIVEVKEEGMYYVCTLNTASDDSDSANKVKETFVVLLKEGTDFELSFTIK